MCSKIKKENEEKEKEGEKKEIVNGIYKPYILIEWRFVNWSILIYNIPLIFIYYFSLFGALHNNINTLNNYKKI